MQIIISPAKTLDFESAPVTALHSQALFLEKSEFLIEKLKKHSKSDIINMMALSDNLAEINMNRFKHWSLPFTPDNAKQAILAFKGDVYAGLDADSMSDDDFKFAQQTIKILSGLYGLLSPLDLIQPYRLEMGRSLKNMHGKNLYHYWRDMVTQALNACADKAGDDIVINLASNEYFKVIDKKQLKPRVITPIFKDQKNGNYKVISFFAKKARGLMSRYVIDHRIVNADKLKDFNVAGYYYNPELSDQDNWVFYRDEADLPKPVGKK